MVSNKIPTSRIKDLDSKITSYDSHVSDETKHVSTQDRNSWDRAATDSALNKKAIEGFGNIVSHNAEEFLKPDQLKTLNGESLSGSGNIEIKGTSPDNSTIINNSQNLLEVIGRKTKDGQILFDWVGTLADWTSGRADGSIPDSYVCYVIDD